MAYKFWLKVRRELNKREMSQTAFARQIGIPSSTITRLKDLANPPSARIVKLIASNLDIDVDEAFVLAGLEAPPLTGIDLREAIRQSDQLTEPGRAAMIAMYDALQNAHSAKQRSGRHKDTA